MPNAIPCAARLRLLVVADALDADAWCDWQNARQASAHAPRIALQRVYRGAAASEPFAVGIGCGETWRWFAAIDAADKRRRVVAYADAVLETGVFPPQAETEAAPAPARGAALEGLVLLTHADTDLLALEQARLQLPADFPAVSGHSLAGLAAADALVALFGARRPPRLLAIVRIHGTAASVPGLTVLVELAQAEGWGVVVISGVGGSGAAWPRTANVTPDLAARLTAYFLAGGAANVAHALRCAAAEQWAVAVTYDAPRPMPAHGLYHPDLLVTSAAEWEAHRLPGRPVAVVLFYRAHVLSGNLGFVDAAVRALERRGFAALGVFTSSLRDRDAAGRPAALSLLAVVPDVIVNTVSFPVFAANPLQPAAPDTQTGFESSGAAWLQALCCGTSRAAWSGSARGLSPAEAAMNVALSECDGRIISVPLSFKEQHRYVPDAERVERVAGLARRLATLRVRANGEKRIGIVLSNAGGKAQRIGGAVGLDTPASLRKALLDLRGAGYDIGPLPSSPDALMAQLLAQGCYDEKHPLVPGAAWRLPRARYVRWFKAQPAAFQASLAGMWGTPAARGPTLAPPFWRDNKQSTRRSPLLALHEPHSDERDYLFCGLQFGRVLVAIQPPRGFGVDPDAVYHAPDLPPCHHYAAFYYWLAHEWCADALVHFGTHGTLEWLPGKAMALSAECAPDVLLGDLPLIYPFVINNPGEGAQAKRRTHAVIVDHLVPPLTHADSYGALAALARLVEEYYRAEAFDTAKLPVLRRQLWELVRTAHLEEDLQQMRRERHGNHEHPWDARLGEQGIPRALEQLSGRGFAHLLEDLDAYLCELGRAQIRGGLHVFGEPPGGAALVDLVFAILRSANGSVPSLVEALSDACGLDATALREQRGTWPAALPSVLQPWAGGVASVGQVRTALDELARALLGELAAQGFAPAAVDAVLRRHFAGVGPPGVVGLALTLRFACETLVPDLEKTTDETRQLLAALGGCHVPAGPSGSPSRGMAHVLPTGRNFYTVDPRALPTPAAWATGCALAREALARYVLEQQRWPESIVLSVWGTPTLRTGGDDIAQALALLGVRPEWEPQTRRPCGLHVVPLSELERPRIDVTLRVSGFFRDALAGLMELFDAAVRRVALLDEPLEQNFVRKHWLAETSAWVAQGSDAATAQRRAAYRVFSSKPGAYGSGLMPLLDSGGWRDVGDLAQAALLAGGWAYAAGCSEGEEAVESFRRRLAGVELVLHNQDTAEQDLFDSTDYFEFHGGLVAAVTATAQAVPQAYCGDSSDPARPQVRTLQGEALRVYRARVINPKWLGALQRHGYRGGLEMAATVDALFGFSATTGIVSGWMFEGVATHFAGGAAREFLLRSNPWALHAIVERLLEAERRGLWRPAPDTLERLRAVFLQSEASLEALAEAPS